MIDGWGVAVDRLISDFAQGTVEWMVEEGERARRLGHRRGPGLARPPGVLVGDAGADPRRDAAGDGPRPQGRPDRARLRPPARTRRSRSPPLRPFIELHEQVAGLVAPSKVVAIALNTSAIASEDGRPGRDRPGRRRDRAAGRRPGPVRRPGRSGRRSSARVEAPAVGRGLSVALHLDHEVLRLALRDPFRIARSDHDAGHAVTTVVVELRDDRYPGLVGHRRGLPGPVLRRDAPRRWPAVLPLLARRGRRARADGRRASPRAGDGDGPRRSPTTAARSARSTSPSTTSPARSPGMPVHRLLGLSAEIPPTDFTLGIDEPAVVAERAAPGGPVPGAQDQGRRRRPTSRRSRRSAAVYDGPIRVDANTGWQPDDAVALLPELERPRRRADRAAVPGAPPRPARAGSRSARRCRSSPTRAR